MSALAWLFLPIVGFLVGAWCARAAHRRLLRGYLDRAITSWRLEHRRHGADAEMAAHYIDAFQSVRMSMLDELLPKEPTCPRN